MSSLKPTAQWNAKWDFHTVGSSLNECRHAQFRIKITYFNSSKAKHQTPAQVRRRPYNLHPWNSLWSGWGVGGVSCATPGIHHMMRMALRMASNEFLIQSLRSMMTTIPLSHGAKQMFGDAIPNPDIAFPAQIPVTCFIRPAEPRHFEPVT